ncbi:hypothetical protein [Reichenbachiella sp. MALMAid0571]|uniref:hypothetical protein n=1 Tax=Reichenbachiella sp. MALMAid0571 TaxID=3143939 RepID=UPI0032DE8553
MRCWIFILACFQVGCNTVDIKDIKGLWELREVKIDEMIKPNVSTFLEIRSNNSFAVSRTTGDFSGIFDLQSDKLMLHSDDKQWFNQAWEVICYRNYMILKAPGLRKTNLKFKRIDTVPDFQEFEDSIIGNWELSEVRKKGKPKKVSDMWFNMEKDGIYSISGLDGVMEEGSYVVNTRHRKIIFEKDSMLWDVSFFGKRLRLNNDQLELQYTLKRN